MAAEERAPLVEAADDDAMMSASSSVSGGADGSSRRRRHLSYAASAVLAVTALAAVSATQTRGQAGRAASAQLGALEPSDDVNRAMSDDSSMDSSSEATLDLGIAIYARNEYTDRDGCVGGLSRKEGRAASRRGVCSVARASVVRHTAARNAPTFIPLRRGFARSPSVLPTSAFRGRERECANVRPPSRSTNADHALRWRVCATRA
jgi:hypothetical protein